MMKKRRFVVKPRSPRIMEQGLSTQKGKVTFGGKTQKIITDETLAREIDTEYGLSGKRDVYVYEDERLAWHDEHDKETDGMNHDEGGHRYTFSGVDTSYIKITKDNGYVWVRKGGTQVRVKREVAQAEGWKIVGQKRKQMRANTRREVGHV